MSCQSSFCGNHAGKESLLLYSSLLYLCRNVANTYTQIDQSITTFDHTSGFAEENTKKDIAIQNNGIARAFSLLGIACLITFSNTYKTVP